MTQESTLLAHLKIYKSITVGEAYDRYNITCAGQRLGALIRKMEPIRKEWEERNGKRYRRWWWEGH